MSTSRTQSIVCISDNQQWLEEVAAAAKDAASSQPTPVSWEQFDSAPMNFAQPNCWAYAHIDDESASLDIRLGKLCRSFPHGVLLELAANVGGSNQQFFAHGFQTFGDTGEKMTPANDNHPFLHPAERSFQFRLEHYKTVPDWLNARYWAHPERFHL